MLIIIVVTPNLFSDITITVPGLDKTAVSRQSLPARGEIVRSLRWVLHARRVVDAVSSSSIDTAGSIVVARFEQLLLNVPVTLFRADTELEIFLGDAVPVLRAK